MGAVKDEGELAALEEHLLVCGRCIERAEYTDRYVEAMSAALKAGRARRLRAVPQEVQWSVEVTP